MLFFGYGLKPYVALTGWTLWRRRNVSPVRCELDFYIPEDDILHSHRREDLKCYVNRCLPADLGPDSTQSQQFLVALLKKSNGRRRCWPETRLGSHTSPYPSGEGRSSEGHNLMQGAWWPSVRVYTSSD
jgi:hypothetical protein